MPPLRVGEAFLLPAGGLLLPGERTLVVADLHVGFAAAWRARGNALPDAEPVLPALELALGEAREALSGLSGTKPSEQRVLRVVVNGDAKHAHAPLLAQSAGMRAADARLREMAPGAEIVYVRGNHDRGLETILPEARIEESLRVGPWTVAHGHEGVEGPAILGHEHPVVLVPDGVGGRIRARAFLRLGEDWLLPAMSPWAAGVDVRTRGFSGQALARRDARAAEAWAIEGDEVFALGRLDQMPRRR